MFSVYKITCAANEKVYIGKTSRSLSRRLKEHINESRILRNRHLCKAIRKHGVSAFSIGLICETDSEQEANRLERFYILHYGSYDHSNGYNDTFGGDGVVGTPETRAKISVAKKGKPLNAAHKAKLCLARAGRKPALGMKHTENWRREHSARMSGKNHPRYGKKHSVAAREKMHNKALGRIPWNKGLHK